MSNGSINSELKEKKNSSRGLRDNTVGMAFALHMANQGSFPGIQYGPPGIVRSNSWELSQKEAMNIARHGPKSKQSKKYLS